MENGLMSQDEFEQLNLFSFAYPAFKFTKPVRLIELFAGYGSQMMAMERLQKEGLLPKGLESWGICEWAIPSFIAWAKIHAKDDHVDYSDGMAKEKVARALFYKGVSLDWKTPAPFEALMRKPEDYLRAAYNAMRSSKNQVDITRTHGVDFSMADREGYEVVMTWSFPCQSLSLAGKRAGMDEGSGSESSLGYEVLRLLDEMKEIGQLPNVLIMENVPQFASKANRENVIKIQDRLGRLGYKSYVKIQSATDFGVPQTRKRCFMISVLGDYSYEFPNGFPLTLRLKDKLEENVDEKYYLSRKMMRYVLSQKHMSFNSKPEVDREIAATIHADTSLQRATRDNYVSKVGEVINVGNLNGHQSGRVFSEDGYAPSVMAHTHGNTRESVLVSEDIAFGVHLVTNGHGKFKKGDADRRVIAESNGLESSYSLTTDSKMNGLVAIVHGLPIKDATKQGFDFAHEGDGVYISNLKTKRGTVQHDMIQTIKTGNGIGVVVSGSICLNSKGGRGGIDGLQPSLENRVYDPDGCAVALATGFQPKYAIGADGRINLSAVYVTDEAEPRYLVWDGKEWRELRIRRLTPRECFRLQDVSDSDFDLIKDSLSESTLYHLAGDSICVANLYHDFKEMCGIGKS